MGTSKTLLITGGAGFIGSHVVRRFVRGYPGYRIVNADKLTYAGNLENLTDIENYPNYAFERADIVNKPRVTELFRKYDFDAVIHLAAESHVDRSISSHDDFVFTNIVGKVNLLNAALATWNDRPAGKLFYHISTDEVYGSLYGRIVFIYRPTRFTARLAMKDSSPKIHPMIPKVRIPRQKPLPTTW